MGWPGTTLSTFFLLHVLFHLGIHAFIGSSVPPEHFFVQTHRRPFHTNCEHPAHPANARAERTGEVDRLEDRGVVSGGALHVRRVRNATLSRRGGLSSEGGDKACPLSWTLGHSRMVLRSNEQNL